MLNLPLMIFSLLLAAAVSAGAQSIYTDGWSDGTRVALRRTQPGSFPSETDSNSPMFWANGQLHLFNSVAGQAVLSIGPSINELQISDLPNGKVRFINPKTGGEDPRNGGRWIEAVVLVEQTIEGEAKQPDDQWLYGIYHNEPAFVPYKTSDYEGTCPGSKKTAPRIGMAVSKDYGRTWQDLGIILQAPIHLIRCDSINHYFVGGLGDPSVVLDREKKFLYVFFGNYAGDHPEEHGVAVARMEWNFQNRQSPVDKFKKFNGTWNSNGIDGDVRPIFPSDSFTFHDATPMGFWGPSIHYNTHLDKYVIVMNKAADSSSAWTQEGIYLSMSQDLGDLQNWYPPLRIIEGGHWYPEIVGGLKDPNNEIMSGTDKLVGQTGALYMKGERKASIIFFRPGEERYCPPTGSAFQCR